MISLRTLRRKIKSVKSIQQIFNAMKMISSVRLKRTKNTFEFAKAYCLDLKKVIAGLFLLAKNRLTVADFPKNLKPFIFPDKKENLCLVVITSDKGLCGSFNSNITRASLDFINKNLSKDLKVITIGKKSRNALIKNIPLLKEFANLSSLNYSDAKAVIDELLDIYIKEGFTGLHIAHAKFKSGIAQSVVVEQFLPLSLDAFNTGLAVPADPICEPEPERLFSHSVPMYIKSEFYKILLDSNLAEHAARIFAMDTAITNSDELICELSLQLNKLRQEKITSEISELTANIL
ncbi:MAG: ATP synthase F1 subunit gamma [Elusimicrobia bacterium]|nr:ATP synthase F1 subunit gamma [Candidatus Liberimonas magnetica]